MNDGGLVVVFLIQKKLDTWCSVCRVCLSSLVFLVFERVNRCQREAKKVRNKGSYGSRAGGQAERMESFFLQVKNIHLQQTAAKQQKKQNQQQNVKK